MTLDEMEKLASAAVDGGYVADSAVEHVNLARAVLAMLPVVRAGMLVVETRSGDIVSEGDLLIGPLTAMARLIDAIDTLRAALEGK